MHALTPVSRSSQVPPPTTVVIYTPLTGRVTIDRCDMSSPPSTMDQLLSIALRNPTEIPTLARLLDLASRTTCTAARELQRAARAWMSRRRQKAEAVLAIQHAARRRRANCKAADRC
eukprot:1908284-Prymnesium_polylepis.1